MQGLPYFWQHSRRHIAIIVVSAILSVTADILTQRKGFLPINGFVLLTHLVPTLFAPFHAFDREQERTEAFIYGNSGNVGIGVFLGAVLTHLAFPDSKPEGVSPSLIASVTVAAVVYLAYWGNGILSRKERQHLAEMINLDNSVRQVLAGLRMARYHMLADEGTRAFVNCNVASLVDSGWVERATQRLTAEHFDPAILEQAMTNVRAMAQQQAGQQAQNVLARRPRRHRPTRVTTVTSPEPLHLRAK